MRDAGGVDASGGKKTQLLRFHQPILLLPSLAVGEIGVPEKNICSLKLVPQRQVPEVVLVMHEINDAYFYGVKGIR